MATIELDWSSWDIPCRLLPKGIIDLELPDEDEVDWTAERVNYVIAFQAPYFVRYLKGKSPVCYIGSGRAWRVLEGWLCKLPVLLANFKGYKLHGCQPRLRGRGHFLAFRRVEADLISFFKETFGERPLFNRQLGNSEYNYDYIRRTKKDVLKIFSCPPKGRFSNPLESLGRQLKKD